MCEVKGKLSSKDLTLKLIERNILIKDLKGKKGIRPSERHRNLCLRF